MRSAEGGKEVVKSILVGHIDSREPQAYFVLVSLENVVMPDGDVEQTPRRYARRILIVILRIGSGHLQQPGAELRHGTRIWQGLRRSRSQRPAKQSRFELLVRCKRNPKR